MTQFIVLVIQIVIGVIVGRVGECVLPISSYTWIAIYNAIFGSIIVDYYSKITTLYCVPVEFFQMAALNPEREPLIISPASDKISIAHNCSTNNSGIIVLLLSLLCLPATWRQQHLTTEHSNIRPTANDDNTRLICKTVA